MKDAELDERRTYLLRRQKELEAEMASADRRRRDELTAEYADLVDELEALDAGAWSPRDELSHG